MDGSVRIEVEPMSLSDRRISWVLSGFPSSTLLWPRSSLKAVNLCLSRFKCVLFKIRGLVLDRSDFVT